VNEYAAIEQTSERGKLITYAQASWTSSSCWREWQAVDVGDAIDAEHDGLAIDDELQRDLNLREFGLHILALHVPARIPH